MNAAVSGGEWHPCELGQSGHGQPIAAFLSGRRWSKVGASGPDDKGEILSGEMMGANFLWHKVKKSGVKKHVFSACKR